MRKLEYIPFKYKLSVVMIVLAILIVGLAGSFLYITMTNDLKEDFVNYQKIVEERIIDAIETSDSTYLVVEQQLDDSMRKISTEICQHYDKVKNPSKLNIDNYTKDLKGIDVYIIDKNYQITHTTDQKDLHLDFRQFPQMVKFLDSVWEQNTYITDRINITIKEKKVKKFSYKPTADGKYIIQLGIDISEYYNMLKNIYFDDVAKNLIDSDAFIQNITLYNSSGYAYHSQDETGRTKRVKKENLAILNQVIQTQKSVEKLVTENGITLRYKYIPYKIMNAQRQDDINVIEIVFSEWILNKQINRINILIGVGGFIAVLLAVLMGLITSKLVSKPIEQMIKQIEFISQGNFERKITIQTNDEFKRLSESCNRMMEHIHGLIDEKKQAAEELRKKNQEIIRQRDEINALYQQTAAMNEELTYLLEESKRNYLHTVRALVNAIEAKDYYTGGHCERVMEYAILIGSAMHLNKKELIDLKFAALLHDVGKIGISSAIINKEGKLTQEEMEIIKKHPKIGYNILKDIQFLEDGLDGILHHHERIDGEGYPDGLTGDEIGLIAKILGVADAYDAMTSSRSYRKIPLTKQKAIEQLIQNKNTQFDTEVVDVFVMSLNKGQVDLNLIEYTG